MGAGIRVLRIADQLPRCEVLINREPYQLENLVGGGKRVLDIGCGDGHTRHIVEQLGGTWEGVEPFQGGGATQIASAEALPFPDANFDVVIMDAVLEHVLSPERAIREVARVLKPGGVFVGYVAFMECFHEISYYHLSFRAVELLAEENQLKLQRISGGHRFGMDYHLRVLFYPIPLQWARSLLAALIRSALWCKSRCTIPALMMRRRLELGQATSLAQEYYKLECLRQSVGFSFFIVKPA